MAPTMRAIPTRAGFLNARAQGTKALSKGLVIQAVKLETTQWRVGLTATRKIGNAVKRNRARRRMRALAYQYLLPIARPGTDYVLIARHDTATANWQEMAHGFQKAINYLHRTMVEKSIPSEGPV